MEQDIFIDDDANDLFEGSQLLCPKTDTIEVGGHKYGRDLSYIEITVKACKPEINDCFNST